ncbi:hypothetical protein [Helicobacter anatolicus]|uniref:hypothetical protein n=1 Tax=Helicobacter anatolicus TaxID=2905874 RepID=UPI001E4FE9A6|nr:hypothetical protein [Helicobacter anatolicus]MCE3040017.1 hypothetical protein [Helicobacter anatolicus]
MNPKIFLQTFLQTYNQLKFDEKKEFFNSFMSEMQENSSQESFIESILNTLEEFKKDFDATQDQNIFQDFQSFLKDFKEEVKQENHQAGEEYLNLLEKEVREIKYSLSLPSPEEKIDYYTATIPLDWGKFNKNLEEWKNEEVKKPIYEQENITKTINIDQNSINVFNRESFIDHEQILESKNLYAKNLTNQVKSNIKKGTINFLGLDKDEKILLETNIPQENLLKHFQEAPQNISLVPPKEKDIVKNHQAGEEFVTTLQEEVLKVHQENNKQQSKELESKKQNTPQSQVKPQEENGVKIPWISWIEQQRIENHDLKMSKADFKKRFWHYAKNGMNDDELKILIILVNKEPSKLTKEHKQMISEGIRLSQHNTKILNQDLLDIAKKINSKENINITNITSKTPLDKEFKKSLEKFANNQEKSLKRG